MAGQYSFQDYFSARVLTSLVMAAVVVFGIFDLGIIGEFGPLALSGAWKKVFSLLHDCTSLFVGGFLYLYICNAAKYAIDAYMTEEAVTYYTDIYLVTSTINLLSSFLSRFLLPWGQAMSGGSGKISGPLWENYCWELSG